MRLTPESLPGALARGLRPAYLVTGLEPLLIAEACDAIRARAREEGYAEREVHFYERGLDWQALLAGAANLSLFANRRVIEIKFASAPDATAQRHLAELAANPPQDAVLLVAGELEWKQQKGTWLAAFERAGALVMTEPVGRAALPEWIRKRLARHGISADDDAAALLADRVEGNLLAAQQDIERIALLMPGARLDAGQVAELVADNARYDVFEVATAAYQGEGARALRILAGLRAEGQEPPLVLWALLNDLRFVSRVLQRLKHERSVDGAMRAERVWGNRQAAVRAAIKRLGRADVERLILAAARADRVAKGSLPGDPWTEIEALVARIAGLPLAA